MLGALGLAPVGLTRQQAAPFPLQAGGTGGHATNGAEPTDPCEACTGGSGCVATCRESGHNAGYCAWPGSDDAARCCDCDDTYAPIAAVGPLPVAIFVHFGNVSSVEGIDQLLTCTNAVSEAIQTIGSTADAFTSFHDDAPPSTVGDIVGRLEQQHFTHVVGQKFARDLRTDVGSFIGQIEKAQQIAPQGYSLALKLHSNSKPWESRQSGSDEIWRTHALESLCGTRAHVQAILAKFSEPSVGMVAPLGFAFGPTTPWREISPIIASGMTANAAFTREYVVGMRRAHKLLERASPTNVSLPSSEQMSVVAGMMFWIRYSALQPEQLTAARPTLEERFTPGHVADLEPALQRLLPSRVTASNLRILQMPPAPKPIALYFPQYHPIPENDRFWGQNFTEWTLLRPFEPGSNNPPVHKPLSTEDGGLGYYNLLDPTVRARQAALAKAYGIHGFCYYHCEWLRIDHWKAPNF